MGPTREQVRQMLIGLDPEFGKADERTLVAAQYCAREWHKRQMAQHAVIGEPFADAYDRVQGYGDDGSGPKARLGSDFTA